MSIAVAAMIVAAASDAGQVDAGLVDACGDTPSWFCEATWKLTHNQLLSRAVEWFVAKPLLALIILLITGLVDRWLRRLVTKVVMRVADRERLAATALETVGVGAPHSFKVTDPRTAKRTATLASVARAGVSCLVWTIGVLTTLGVFNFNLGPLLAGAGVAGIAVGLGGQNLVKDCIAGFFIIIEDQFGVGDEADLGLAAGTIESTTLRSTALRSGDGTLWHIPNGAIARVGNQSKLWSNAVLDVTIWYEADVDSAAAQMNEVATEVCARPEMAAVVLNPPQVLGVERLTADGVVLRLVVRTKPGAHIALMRALRSALKTAFESSGVALHPPLPPAST